MLTAEDERVGNMQDLLQRLLQLQTSESELVSMGFSGSLVKAAAEKSVSDQSGVEFLPKFKSSDVSGQDGVVTKLVPLREEDLIADYSSVENESEGNLEKDLEEEDGFVIIPSGSPAKKKK